MNHRNRLRAATGMLGALLLASACATDTAQQPLPVLATASTDRVDADIARDRAAIMAMAGDYRVRFSFTETVPFVDGYAVKEPKLSGGHEVVRVIRDEPGFISLQHTLVVGGEQKFAIKHWRQDWVYEPDCIMEFVGGNAWQKRWLTPAERAGKWAQIVYQVDDAPRYAAVAAWDHENGVSAWTSPPNLRPLPRRDATKRDDYDAILATNRHAWTPTGWVHEQDNSKLILRTGEPQILVREVGLNTYDRDDSFDETIAESYWAATEGYWAIVRDKWTALETDNAAFGLTIQGEPEALYMPLLDLAGEVESGEKSAADAGAEAVAVIDEFTITEIGTVEERLAGYAAAGGDAY